MSAFGGKVDILVDHCDNLIGFENWRHSLTSLRRVTCAGEISSKLLLALPRYGRSQRVRSSASESGASAYSHRSPPTILKDRIA